MREGKGSGQWKFKCTLESNDPSSTEAEPPTSVAPPQLPTRHSGHARKVPKKEGNVYGDKHPIQIERDI